MPCIAICGSSSTYGGAYMSEFKPTTARWLRWRIMPLSPNALTSMTLEVQVQSKGYHMPVILELLITQVGILRLDVFEPDMAVGTVE